MSPPQALSISAYRANGIDLDWYLYPATGSYVCLQIDFRFRRSYNAPATGTYYIRIKTYSGTGSYTLNVTFLMVATLAVVGADQ